MNEQFLLRSQIIHLVSKICDAQFQTSQKILLEIDLIAD